MGDILSATQLGLGLQSEIVVPVADFLIGMAEGLVVDEIGVRLPWPQVAVSVVLAAAGRAYRNPKGQVSKSVDMARDKYNPEDFGVYLSQSEIDRLHRWKDAQTPPGAGNSPVGAFPNPLPYPDPAYPRPRCHQPAQADMSAWWRYE